MDHYQRSSRNGFAAYVLDRVSHRRKDENWLQRQLESEASLFLPVWQSRNLVQEGETIAPAFLQAHQLNGCLDKARGLVFLGRKGPRNYFAVHLPNDETCRQEAEAWGVFRNLRNVSAALGHEEGTLLAYARAICHWHERNGYCSVCGSPTESGQAGHVRVCTSEKCGQMHFPRTDPAIIVLVHSGDHCLLGRQAGWPAHMYSTLAGFVEPGETLENAVMREVSEETGVQVREICYHSSQPWPFPSSLMLGFTAEGIKAPVVPRDQELEDARWFSRQEMISLLETQKLRLPSAHSIAFRLMEDWFNAHGDRPLRDWLS